MDDVVRTPVIDTEKSNKKANYYRWLLKNNKPRYVCQFTWCKTEYFLGDEIIELDGELFCIKCGPPFGGLTDLWKKAWHKKESRPLMSTRKQKHEKWYNA